MGTIYQQKLNQTKQKTIIIKTLNEYIDFVKRISSESGYIFRGICSKEQMLPKIIRNKDISFSEIEILKEFEKRYLLYKAVDDVWDFVTLAQHNGLITRLIDFTENFFIATFFALHCNKKRKSDRYMIYVAKAVDYYYEKPINPFLTTKYKTKKFDNYADEFIQEISSHMMHDAILIRPKYSNNKIFVQQGLFIVPITLNQEHIYSLYSKMPFVVKIKDEARDEIVSFLEKNGFDEFKVLPGLENTCCEINTKFEQQWKK